MAKPERGAVVGVAEHGNSAVLITLIPGGECLDRRRVDLTSGLPTHPYHHEGSWAVGRYLNSWSRAISLPEAVALVARVRAAAAHGARASLEALSRELTVPITGIALRVFREVAAALSGRDVDGFLQAMGRSLGPPWQAKHKLAAAAALAAAAP